MSDLVDIKIDAKYSIDKLIDSAYKLGQSQEYADVKSELDETLKYAQEAYEFFKVVCNRMCMSDNNLESTTKSYLHEIGNQLKQIKGIKK